MARQASAAAAAQKASGGDASGDAFVAAQGTGDGAGVGHNSGKITVDQREALWLRRLGECERVDAELEKAMAAVKEVRKKRNKVRAQTKEDGFPLELVDVVLNDMGQPAHVLQDKADLLEWLKVTAGQPVANSGPSTQGDLFERKPDEGRDLISAETDGYQAGRRALEKRPPDWVDPIHHQAWLREYDAGQERNAWALAESDKIVDRQAGFPASRPPLEPEPEGDDEEGGEDRDHEDGGEEE
jgi:hypothetical protein